MSTTILVTAEAGGLESSLNFEKIKQKLAVVVAKDEFYLIFLIHSSSSALSRVGLWSQQSVQRYP